MTKPPAILVVMALLTGCQARDQSEEASPPSGTLSAIEAKDSAMLRLEPTTLENCTPVAVQVKWDASTIADVTAIEIRVDDATGTLFAVGGPSGESSTGAWAKPGGVFVLLDATSRKELARSVIGGPGCD